MRSYQDMARELAFVLSDELFTELAKMIEDDAESARGVAQERRGNMKCAECGIELFTWGEVAGYRDGVLGGPLCEGCQRERRRARDAELERHRQDETTRACEAVRLRQR